MYYYVQHYNDALESYQVALQIRRDMYQNNDTAHPDIASTLNSIGLIFYRQEMYTLAIQCFNECLTLRQKLFGANSREVSIAWYNLATVQLELGCDDIAVQCYKESIRIEKEVSSKRAETAVPEMALPKNRSC